VVDDWATDAFRDEVRRASDAVLDGDVCDGAMTLWRLGMANSGLGFAGGLWNIWGPITDEYTAPTGDASEGRNSHKRLRANSELRSETRSANASTATGGSTSG